MMVKKGKTWAFPKFEEKKGGTIKAQGRKKTSWGGVAGGGCEEIRSVAISPPPTNRKECGVTVAPLLFAGLGPQGRPFGTTGQPFVIHKH